MEISIMEISIMEISIMEISIVEISIMGISIMEISIMGTSIMEISIMGTSIMGISIVDYYGNIYYGNIKQYVWISPGIPSGNDYHSYEKSPLIVDISIVIFHSYGKLPEGSRGYLLCLSV